MEEEEQDEGEGESVPGSCKKSTALVSSHPSIPCGFLTFPRSDHLITCWQIKVFSL